MARAVVSGVHDNKLAFNAMFPEGGYFGESGVIGPANQVSLQPIFGLDLGSGWSLSGAAGYLYWTAKPVSR